MVSLKEIARNCGVSVATVSKALNDKSDIAEETKNHIRKVAEEMGYMVNASARALKTNRTYNIGVVFNDDKSAGLAHEYFSTILNSFKVSAEADGYDITFINRVIAGKQYSYLKHCEYRNFDGVAIICADYRDPEIVELVDSEIPAVTVDYEYGKCSSVISDNTKGVTELVQYAAGRGHRRIAFIHGEMTDVTSKRLMGFYSTCMQMGIEMNDDYIIESNYHDIEMCAEAMERLLKLEERPTCVICPDDYSAMGALKVINANGLKVPEDISVMGYDGINLALINGITTYQQDTEALGTTAFRKLSDRINDPEAPLEHLVVFGRLIEGTTVKDIGK